MGGWYRARARYSSSEASRACTHPHVSLAEMDKAK
jgi:hypothetical protein